MEGQGTIGKEILSQAPDKLDYIFVPIGGGGLASGLGSYIKAMSPETKIIGVEPGGAPCMKAAIENGGPVELEEIDKFVDGAAVKKAGADLGVIFDTDCDRAAVVDADGSEINRNRLIALISAILLDEKPGQTIVTDSVTSSGLARFIQEWGGEHYRYKRGYRNVIDEAVRLNEAGIDCPLAIETSGHAALRDNHFLDDGMYLVTVMLIKAMQLKQQGENLGKLLEGLREPVESTEIRV
jgi:phosphomannomutase